MIIPDFLKQGDKIVIVATARKVSPEEIKPSVDLFRSWGLEVVTDETLYAADNQFAGNDALRAASLQQYLDNPEVKAIVCARGGYGTVRIIDHLDFTAFARHPKWIVGYSDVTVLHSHINKNLGISTLHATMPLNIPADATEKSYPSIESLKAALFGDLQSYSASQLLTPSSGHNRCGRCRGQVVGGNLSILYSLCGSASDISTEGKILFIEDLDEYLYHIDRMMQNLKRTGKLQKINGLIVGAMSDMHDNTIPYGKTAEEIVLEAVADYDYPVLFSENFGHVGTENLALPLGVEVEMVVNEDDISLRFV
ncbi:MAG: LD-carboxypeptidase [Bacteroidales bacterium]|nr:LD-carboxypeptidase [Bacteroidales bacterium]MBP5759060.1 LD-carboxypeptidase [Bacteroidales bacterium]